MDRNLAKPLKYSFCRSSFVYNTIQSYKTKAITIDTRSSEFYSKYRISDSINLNDNRVQRYLQNIENSSGIPELNMQSVCQMLNTEESQKLSERKRCFCLIIMSETPLISEFLSEVRALAEACEQADNFSVLEEHFNDAIRALIERIKEEEKSVSLGFELFKILKKDRVQEVHLLIDGASQFFTRYPFMDQDFYANLQTLSKNSLSVTKLDKLYDLPQDILEGRLFLGNCIHAKQFEVLKRLKITHIVNTANECINVHEKEGISYLKLYIRDETEDRFSLFFRDVYDFIHEALTSSNNGGVFVHCALGKSRSATIVIMYIMKRFSWSFKKAYDYVKGKRSVIKPYCGFVNELEELEARNFEFE